MYKTLPSALRRDDRAKHAASAADPSQISFDPGDGSSESASGPAVFSLNLNLGLSNLISGGMNFFGQLRKGHKSHSSASTPVAATHTASHSQSSSSLSSDLFYEAYEQIELNSFPSIPEAGEGQTGEGHRFQVTGSLNPTWCDLCGELIWGLYDTGASKCLHCQFTCHVKCQRRVRLNCSILASDEEERLLKTSEEISETLKNAAGEKKDRLLKEAIEEEEEEEDPSTLANISTLRSEVMEDRRRPSASSSNSCSLLSSLAESPTDVDDGTLRNHPASSSQQQFLSALGDCDDGGSDDDDDDDDDYKTLKDVDHFELEHDGAFGELSLVQSLQLPLRSPQLLGPDLDQIIGKYNEHGPAGQETVLESEDQCRGFIRVQLNLRRPINVISGTRPPSIYNITKDESMNNRTLTSFYLPADTVKALHVTSVTTTSDVIKSLLAKFRVADNPHKYALYEKSFSTPNGEQPTEDKSTLSRVRMRKMKDSERPLVLALVWCKEDLLSDKIFVLQENDPGEICWESFSVPELKNFLLILDREEAWYKKKIHEKYELVHGVMEKLADQKKKEMDEKEESNDLNDSEA